MLSFWTGLTTGEQIVFPLLVLAFVGVLVSLAVFGGSAGAWPLLLLVLILWTVRRGRKNAGQ